MRFPLSLAVAMTGYIARRRLAGERRFPMVLMLEPLHACNLACRGCARANEYRDTIDQQLSVAECLDSLDECGAPVVSICGGEPLLYAEIGRLAAGILARGKHIYLCTNGLRLVDRLGDLRPHPRLYLNVHLDGLAATHDRSVGRRGVFDRAVRGLDAAKRAGFRTCTNTTVYRDTRMADLVRLFEHLRPLRVDAHMVSPAYGFSGVRDDGVFMTRDEIRHKFARAQRQLDRFPLGNSPVYLDFLCGARDLPCAAWANPTRNVRGWRSPCYLLADTHCRTFRELVRETDWDRYGPGRDPRCADCMVHYGFEPAAVLGLAPRPGDMLRMLRWQFR